jgi:hypothetical protein
MKTEGDERDMGEEGKERIKKVIFLEFLGIVILFLLR